MNAPCRWRSTAPTANRPNAEWSQWRSPEFRKEEDSTITPQKIITDIIEAQETVQEDLGA